jgi:hypothetical protein
VLRHLSEAVGQSCVQRTHFHDYPSLTTLGLPFRSWQCPRCHCCHNWSLRAIFSIILPTTLVQEPCYFLSPLLLSVLHRFWTLSHYLRHYFLSISYTFSEKDQTFPSANCSLNSCILKGYIFLTNTTGHYW